MLRFHRMSLLLCLTVSLAVAACSPARPVPVTARPETGGAAADPAPAEPTAGGTPTDVTPAAPAATPTPPPTVRVEDANGPMADLSKPAQLALGDSALTLRFDRPMDRAGVERRLSAGAYLLLPGFNTREPQLTANLRKPASLTISWENDFELKVVVQGLGRFQLDLGGLPAQNGSETRAMTLEAWRPDSSMGTLAPETDAKPAKAGYWPSFLFAQTYARTQVHPDGHAMLFVDAQETGFAPDYQLWLWTGSLYRLPDRFYAGDTFMAELFPGGKGAVVADSEQIHAYGPDGTGRIIWQSKRLIHGIGLSPQGNRLAIFVQGEGADIHLVVIDPMAADPPATATDYGAVDQEELRPSNTEVSRHRRIQGRWSPDGSEIAWGGGTWQEGGMVWAPFSYRFRLSDKQLTGPVQGLEFQGWSPDGKRMLYSTGYRSVQGQPGLKTVVKTAAGGEAVAELPGAGWRWGDPDLLWRAEPFQWQRLGGPITDGPAGWIPIGWLTASGAEHCFAIIPTPESRE